MERKEVSVSVRRKDREMNIVDEWQDNIIGKKNKLDQSSESPIPGTWLAINIYLPGF